MSTYDVVILGSGPAGLTAALYAARARLNVLVIAGYEAGGQLMLTSDVENYPGFPEGVQGPELMDRFRKQAERFGTEFIDRDATEIDVSSRPFKISMEDETVEAGAVIVATGASARWLGLESEEKLRGRGVSSCATCDGAFFRDKDVVVVGGGDSAMEEALFLTRFASKVTIVHRRDEFRASKIMQERALDHDQIEVRWNSEVVEVLGEDNVEGVRVITHPDGTPKEKVDWAEGDIPAEKLDGAKEDVIKADGFFLAIGHTPNTKFLEGVLEMDQKGYVQVRDGTRTNVEGIFVAGDVRDARYRQAVTAAGMGCMAAMDAEKWLEEQEHGSGE